MLTVTQPVIVGDPDVPFDSAVFGLQIVPRIVDGVLTPAVAVRLRRGRKKNDLWEVWGDDVWYSWPSLDALAEDLPEAMRPQLLQVWQILESMVQAVIERKNLL